MELASMQIRYLHREPGYNEECGDQLVHKNIYVVLTAKEIG